jgi:hypothetical protein
MAELFGVVAKLNHAHGKETEKPLPEASVVPVDVKMEPAWRKSATNYV